MPENQDFLNQLLLDDRFQKWILNPDLATEQYWQKYLQQHPERAAVIKEAKAALLSLDYHKAQPTEIDQSAIFEKIQQRIAQANEEAITRRLTVSSGNESFTQRWSYAVAASFIGVLLIAGGWFYAQWLQTVVHTTAYGESKTVALPDGSQVILNANSRLAYKRDMEEGEVRTVSLEGEAFFSVVHTLQDKPFIVESGKVAIEVLGTKFNVHNRRGENRIMLEEGSIRLNLSQNTAPSIASAPDSQSEALLMEPGDVVLVDEDQSVITQKAVNPEVHTGWTKNKLVFDNMSLLEVADMIKDNYGYTVSFNGLEAESLTFSAELYSSNLDLIVNYLSEAFDLSVQKNNREIIFSTN